MKGDGFFIEPGVKGKDVYAILNDVYAILKEWQGTFTEWDAIMTEWNWIWKDADANLKE